jgi:hypothetical protein
MPILFHRNLSLGTAIYICLIGCLFALGLLYALFQARYLIEGPTITVSEAVPMEESDRVVTLAGVAENITSLTLNGRTIYTDDRGAFSEAVVLPEGYTIMTLVAEDRYGRTTSVERTYTYTAHN